MHVSSKQLVKLASLVTGMIFVVGMLILLNVYRASVYNGLAALDLIPKPEKLTELYFSDNANLPDNATRNQIISFTFVIHNLETTDYQYSYDVVVIANGTRHLVDSGNVQVINNQYYAKQEKFNLINSPGRQDVIVELTNIRQSIDFWAGN